MVAEDDDKQAELVRRYLEREGHTVRIVGDGLAALDAVRQREPDLLVLDVMMPRADGLDVVRVLRAETRELPVLMLTARSTEDDLLLGLDLGADDYMTKPYSPRELMARVRTLLRRARRPVSPEPPAEDPVLRVGALVVDPERHEVSVDGGTVECTPVSSGFWRHWRPARTGCSAGSGCWRNCTGSTATSAPGPSMCTS